MLISHRLSLLQIADHVIVLERGRVRAEGTAEEVRTHVAWVQPSVAAAFTDPVPLLPR